MSGDVTEAWGDPGEVLEIAERGEMKLIMVDYHLAAGALYEAEGKGEDAREEREAARVLIEETGYGRRGSGFEWGGGWGVGDG